jgi:hypothetical protein
MHPSQAIVHPGRHAKRPTAYRVLGQSCCQSCTAGHAPSCREAMGLCRLIPQACDGVEALSRYAAILAVGSGKKTHYGKHMQGMILHHLLRITHGLPRKEFCHDRTWCGALCPEIAAPPMHGLGIEVRAWCLRQVRVYRQRFRRGDALEDWENGGGGAHVVTHPHVDQRGALDRRGEMQRIKAGTSSHTGACTAGPTYRSLA